MTTLTQPPTGTASRMPEEVALKALAIARRIARRLQRRGVIRRSGVDDFTGDLVLHAVKRWPQFDDRLSSAATFLTTILWRAAISILRARQAPKRGHGRCASLTDGPTCDSQTPDTHTCMAISVDHADAVDRRLDLESVLGQLPDETRAYCALLMIMTKHEIVRLLRVSRYHVAARICEIHQRCESAGLYDYHWGVNQAKRIGLTKKANCDRHVAHRLRK